jgi:hypothetical protein
MNSAAQRLSHLGIDLAAKPGQAAKRRLDVTAGTAEPVIKIEMPKSSVEIVEPHQTNHATAKPDAFRVSGRATDGLGCLDEFIGLFLIFLGGISRGRRRRFALLILGAGISALANSTSDAEQEDEPGDGEVAQNRVLKLKHPSTHKFPDLLFARGQPDHAGLMPPK